MQHYCTNSRHRQTIWTPVPWQWVPDSSSWHPKFKLGWIDNPKMKVRCSMLLQNAVDDVRDCTERSSTGDSTTSANSTETAQTVSTTTTSDNFFEYFATTQTEDPHLMYLNDTSRDTKMLDNHPLVKSLFLHFNTNIPCSAPAERLFSSPAGALILSKKRNKLTDKRFEQLLLLKVKHHCNIYRLNQSLWQWLLITKSSTIVHLVMSFDFWIFYSLAVVHYQHFT